MDFPQPMVPGRLVRRYKRFLADVVLEDGRAVVAHCCNPGSMLGLAEPGARVWLSPATNPARKLAWSWELVEARGALVGINTAHPNRLGAEAIRDGLIPELAGYARLRREVKYGRNSRIDLLLEDDARPPAYVEIKNVHLSRPPGVAEFPDSATVRGAKHLEELGDVAEAGQRAVMLFLVQRSDCERFSLAADIDPVYAASMLRARGRGVEILCYSCTVSVDRIAVDRPVCLDGGF